MADQGDNRQWSNRIKEKVKNADLNEIMSFYEELCIKWTADDEDPLRGACKNFNITDIKSVDTSILRDELDRAMLETTIIYGKFKSTVPEYEKYMSSWDRIYEVITISERLLRDNYLMRQTNTKSHNPLSNEDPDMLFKFSRFTDESKKTPYQMFLLFFFEKIHEEGFTRYGCNLYKPIIKKHCY